MLSLAAMLIVAMAAALSSCSTTRRLPKGETLYTGVKRWRYRLPDGAKVPGGVADKVKSAVDVKPNQFKVMGFPVPIPVGCGSTTTGIPTATDSKAGCTASSCRSR